MLFKKTLGLAVAGLLAIATPVVAAELEPVTPEPIDHVEAALVVVDTAGNETTYTPAELEVLGMYRMVTTTPWRSEPTPFEGTLLSVLLEKHGMQGVDALRVIAENEFETVIERAVWETAPVMLATRVNGRAHSRRERGPIQFVVSMDDYEGSGVIGERHLVWMAARIEPKTD